MATAAAAPSSGGGMDPISSAVGAATMVAQTVANIVDQNKRRQFEQSLSLLSVSQTAELNEKLLRANTQNERLAILSDTMVKVAISNQQAANRTKTILLIAAGAIGVALLVVAVVLSKRK